MESPPNRGSAYNTLDVQYADWSHMGAGKKKQKACQRQAERKKMFVQTYYDNEKEEFYVLFSEPTKGGYCIARSVKDVENWLFRKEGTNKGETGVDGNDECKNLDYNIRLEVIK